MVKKVKRLSIHYFFFYHISIKCYNITHAFIIWVKIQIFILGVNQHLQSELDALGDLPPTSHTHPIPAPFHSTSHQDFLFMMAQGLCEKPCGLALSLTILLLSSLYFLVPTTISCTSCSSYLLKLELLKCHWANVYSVWFFPGFVGLLESI